MRAEARIFYLNSIKNNIPIFYIASLGEIFTLSANTVNVFLLLPIIN